MIEISKLIPGGMGLGTAPDGRKVFFWNALPGEQIQDFQVTKRKSSYSEAIATEIKNHSSHRISPLDPCFLSTSPWQIMDYDYELSQKQVLLKEIFREHHIEIDTPEIITDGQDFHYRNKMEYSLYWDMQASQIHPAFRQRGSHRKIPITNSSIERPEIFSKAREIIDDLNARGEEARKYQSLLLRCNQKGEVSGGLYVNHQPHPRFKPLTDTILSRSYSYSPNGFFQVNLPVYELALKEIKRHITTDEVLDLYAGVGTIGLSVAQGHQLTLVEVDKYAFQELTNNCHNATSGTSKRIPRAILSPSEEALDYINPNQTVILDPPRAGCYQHLIEKLLETRPTTIIYLSCNPATQARDLESLLGKYQIKTIKAYNFFPRTPHIENLIVLS